MNSNYIFQKTKYISTDRWRGYSQPINAVAGANDTGEYFDSPCKSSVRKREIAGFKKLLRKENIKSSVMVCETSNVFCVHFYVLVHPTDRERALEIADEYYNECSLFYTVKD